MAIYIYRCYQDGTYIIGKESDWKATREDMKYNAQNNYDYDLICVVYEGYDCAEFIARALASRFNNDVCDLIHPSY